MLIGLKKLLGALPLAVAGAAMASPVRAAEAIDLPPFGQAENTILLVVLVCAIFAILFGVWLRAQTLRRSPGSAEMQEVGGAIQSGAYAYLAKQIKTMLFFVIGITIGLYLMYRPIYADDPALAFGIAAAFFLGVMASYCAGLVGMDMAVKGNMRTANQALSTFKGALETAFRAGGVSGMFTVGLGLLGAIIIFFIFKQDAMKVLVGFGFGGSLAALFMRVGGGIFTKAADVGADLVGKVEAGIPEDDPRNAAVIADNVGDNVGDCAGMAADVFESYEVTLVAAIILGADALRSPSLNLGNLLSLLVSLFYAAYMLITQRGRARFDALSYFWLTTVVSLITLFFMTRLFQQSLVVPAATFPFLLGMGLVTPLGGWLSVNYAQGHLPASLVSPTMLGQPVVAALLAFVLLGEALTLLQVVGGAVVLLGISLVHRARG